MRHVVQALAVATALVAPPASTDLAAVANLYPAEVRLPPYAGTRVYRFTSPVRFRAILESGGRLFAIATGAFGARLLELEGRTFVDVPLPGGPFVSLEVRELDRSVAFLLATTGDAKPAARHFVLARGRVARTKIAGDGLQTAPSSGVRCLDARSSSAFDGAALIVIDQATGDLQPSISKRDLAAVTGGASRDRSYALRCHDFGADVLVWLADTAPVPATGRAAGLTLRAGAKLSPLVGVAPVAVSEHYVLFELGDPADGAAPHEYTLVRTS